MPITITKLSPAIAAEVAGVDCRGPIDDATSRAIRQAWHDHLVLLFRGQSLDPDQQIRFSEIFGTVGQRHRPRDLQPEGDGYRNSVMLISNIRKDGKPIGVLPDGEMMFHHDTIHTEQPDKATVLHAVEIPSTGGNTMFANMYRAYETLPAGIRERLEGRMARHRFHYGSQVRGDSKGTEAFGESVHPVFRTNPETGRKALYVNRLMTEEIVGLETAESRDLLALLFDHAENPDFVYEHIWQVGDLVIWDNRCSTHARTDFPAAERRLLTRTTVEGEPVI